jgi:hypothetical protein
VVVNLKLKASYRLAALLGAAHAGTGAALLFLDLDPGLRLVLACAVILSFTAAVRRAALLKTRDAIVALEWSDDGAVNFQTRDGAWHAARLLPTTFVTPALTVINLRTVDRRRARHVVLMPDSAGGEEYRRLRVRLQWDRTKCA